MAAGFQGTGRHTLYFPSKAEASAGRVVFAREKVYNSINFIWANYYIGAMHPTNRKDDLFMNAFHIERVTGREIIDSRGNPTWRPRFCWPAARGAGARPPAGRPPASSRPWSCATETKAGSVEKAWLRPLGTSAPPSKMRCTEWTPQTSTAWIGP